MICPWRRKYLETAQGSEVSMRGGDNYFALLESVYPKVYGGFTYM